MATRSSGVFSALGGDIIVTVDIVPDPLTIESQLMEAAYNLEDTIKPMLAARQVAKEDIQAHFDSESDPNGTKWHSLDPTYAQYKESLGYPPDILHRTGDLESAATSDAAFTITPHGMWFNWDMLPTSVSDGRNYGKVHQAGSESDTLRIVNPFSGEKIDARHTIGAGTGNALPARPFVGMSEIAKEEFWAIFDIWFDEAVDVVVHPSGRMQSHAGGKFGKNIRF